MNEPKNEPNFQTGEEVFTEEGVLVGKVLLVEPGIFRRREWLYTVLDARGLVGETTTSYWYECDLRPHPPLERLSRL